MTSAGGRRAVFRTGALTGLTVAFMLATSMGPNLVLVTGAGVLVGAAAWMLSVVGRSADTPAAWDTDARHLPASAEAAGLDGVWRYRVPSGPRDERAAERLYGILVELLDDRLAAHHGISRERDPGPARMILGDDLSTFAGDPAAARSLTRLQTVTQVVDRIEQI